MLTAGAALASLLILAPAPAAANRPVRASAPEPTGPGALCHPAIAAAEAAHALPGGLLRSIALVESGRADPATRRAVPWPWTINAAGAGQWFESREQAIAAVRAHQAAGVRSIDVGCAQVNLLHHPNAFPSLEDAFDPATNTAYAARFLRSLHGATGGRWPLAAAAYHSWTPELGHAYAQRVAAVWPDAARHGPWPEAPVEGFAAMRGAMGAVAPARPDYSVLTPAFAAQVRRMDEDRATAARRPAAVAARGPQAAVPRGPAPVRGAGAAAFWVNRPPEPVPVRAALRLAGGVRLPAPEPVVRTAAVARSRAGGATRLASAGGP